MPAGTTYIDAARRLWNSAGVDRAVGFTVLGRVWSSAAGLISLVVVGQCLTPGEQGYYYTFTSLLALQVFAEMGLANVILQFVSHEAAHLEITPNGIVDGPTHARSRLASVLRFSLRWYGAAAAVFAVAIVCAGYIFFSNFSDGRAEVAWQLPWISTVLASAGILLVTPIAALLEGCGMVAEVARYRLLQALAANAALWIALVVGAGLAAAAVFAATNLVVMLAWLAVRYRRLVIGLLTINGRETIDWRHEIWPYQWRIAISWLCGYFIFQMFTPLVFAVHGPIPAGRMGMSLTIAAAVSAVGLSWLSTKAPRFGALVSLRRFSELDRIFFRSMKQAIGVSAVCACIIAAAGVSLHAMHHPFADRILPPWPLVFLLVAQIVNLVVTSEATYLRAFKQEPFLVVSMISAALTTLSALILARVGSTTEIAFGYLVINTLVGLGLGTWVFRAKRRHLRWEVGTGGKSDTANMLSQSRIAA
jgi:hypothetical protein